jgi:hypothetical protein
VNTEGRRTSVKNVEEAISAITEGERLNANSVVEAVFVSMDGRRERVKIVVAMEYAIMGKKGNIALWRKWNMCSRQGQVQLCQMQIDQKVRISHTFNHLRDLAVDPRTEFRGNACSLNSSRKSAREIE